MNTATLILIVALASTGLSRPGGDSREVLRLRSALQRSLQGCASLRISGPQGVRLFSSGRLDTTKTVDVTCPLDGTKFKATEVVWTNATLAWGGEDADFCRHAFDTLPMENYVWTCPTCHFSGSKAHFLDPKQALTEDQKKKIKGALKPAIEIKPGTKQEQIPGWVKYDLLAQVEALKGATPHAVGIRHLSAAWAARQAGAIRLDDYDDWSEASKSAGFEKPPFDLGKDNRADLDLTACRKLERDLAKHSGTALLLRKHLLAYNFRRRGENVDALRWLDELDKSKGENSIVDDAAKKMRDSIAVEREQLRKAAAQFTKAVEGPEVALARYWLGEIARRAGDAAEARGWYDKAIETTGSEALKKKAQAQRELVK
jgi:uncharacterized protein (DUF2225 family)